jgi:hypothetical protein
MTASLLSMGVGLFTATAFGSMCFFAAVMAPLIFTQLPEETSGPFIRRVFPWYYLALLALTGLAALLALTGGQVVTAAVLGSIALGFAVARQILMPRINRLRDRAQSGDAEAAHAFDRSHQWSVRLNVAQMVGLLAILIHML